MTPFVGTKDYRAPAADTSVYDASIDVFSLGETAAAIAGTLTTWNIVPADQPVVKALQELRTECKRPGCTSRRILDFLDSKCKQVSFSLQLVSDSRRVCSWHMTSGRHRRPKIS